MRGLINGWVAQYRGSGSATALFGCEFFQLSFVGGADHVAIQLLSHPVDFMAGFA
jgi:hypothetical protein